MSTSLLKKPDTVKGWVIRIAGGFVLFLFVWILADIYIPVRSDIRNFEPKQVGQLEAGMWRSYYERRPLRLIGQLTDLIRSQYRAPYWRSWQLGYRAGKAAFVFKDGKNQQDYAKALPYIQRFYEGISDLSETPFPAGKVASLELKWWMIRREKNGFRPDDWENVLKDEAAAIFGIPADRFREHAQLRVRAMMYRDYRGKDITETDWKYIEELLEQSWTALHKVVNTPVPAN